VKFLIKHGGKFGVPHKEALGWFLLEEEVYGLLKSNLVVASSKFP
jgi:hypothetical protein